MSPHRTEHQTMYMDLNIELSTRTKYTN